MKQEIGAQYSKDKKTDPSGFLAKARLHQSTFRAQVLEVPFQRFGNYLTKEDAEKGLNFYSGFGIVDEVRNRYPEYTKGLMDNLLRSDHIPFNLFVPLKSNKKFGMNVLNDVLSDKVESIDEVLIEYAPSPTNKFLNDNTSFDSFIGYTNNQGEKCALGIVVKYTDREHKLKAGSKEARDIKAPESIYNIATKGCELYKPEYLESLKEDDFRELWKTHLLGERLIYKEKDRYKKFTLLTIFPEGNEYLLKVNNTYESMLIDNKGDFIALTYENFITACEKHSDSEELQSWIDYLKTRYVVE